MSALQAELQEVFRHVFDDDHLTICSTTSAEDIDTWDSMAQINLIIAIEKRFNIKLAAGEIATLSRRGQTVGSIMEMVAAKVGSQK